MNCFLELFNMQRPPTLYLTHRINSAEIQRLLPRRTTQSSPAQTVGQRITACTQLSGFFCSCSLQQTQFVYCRAGWTNWWAELCDWDTNEHLLTTRLQGAGIVTNSEISLWSSWASPFVPEGVCLGRLGNCKCNKAVLFHLPKERKRERKGCGCVSFPFNLSPFCEITIMPWICWAASANCSQFYCL